MMAKTTAETTITLDKESMKVLSEFSETARELFESNTRLLDAEERITLAETIFLKYNPDNEEEHEWVLDQLARAFFGPKYSNFIAIKNHGDVYKWSVGQKP